MVPIASTTWVGVSSVISICSFILILLFSGFADMAGAQSGSNPPDPFPVKAVDQTGCGILSYRPLIVPVRVIHLSFVSASEFIATFLP
jgi:hypothetical protein